MNDLKFENNTANNQDAEKQKNEANELLRAKMNDVWYEDFKDLEGESCTYIDALLEAVASFTSELRMIQHKDADEIKDYNLEGFRETLDSFKKLLSRLE